MPITAKLSREERINAFESRVEATLEKMKSDLLIWTFVFWVGTMGTVLAIVKL